LQLQQRYNNAVSCIKGAFPIFKFWLNYERR
jgi:hypothetical protein